eukprot:m51a1_g1726 hypothetical protein (877) ;mRNA; f:122457-125954
MLRDVVELMGAVSAQGSANRERPSVLVDRCATALAGPGASAAELDACRRALSCLLLQAARSPRVLSPPAACAPQPPPPRVTSPPFALVASERDAALVAELRKRVAKLEAENAELRRQLAAARGPADAASSHGRSHSMANLPPKSQSAGSLAVSPPLVPAGPRSPLVQPQPSPMVLSGPAVSTIVLRPPSVGIEEMAAAETASSEPAVDLSVGPVSLHVRVVAANNVKCADFNGFSDPYVILRIGKTQHRTKTIQKTLNPRWDETFLFKDVDMQGTLVAEAWDWDAIGKDDFLGVIDIPLCTLGDGKPRECRFVLQPKSGESVSGDLHLVLQCTPPDAKPVLAAGQVPNLRPLVHIGNGQLIVRVIEAKGLKACDSGGTSDPYAVLDVDKQTARTGVVEKTLAPHWDNTFFFEANEGSRLDITVFDWNKVTAHEAIGTARVPVRSLLLQKPEDVKDEWIDLTPAKQGETRAVGSVHVALQYVTPVDIPLHQIANSDFFKTGEDTWSSEPLPHELWTETPQYGTLLVDKKCLGEGFHIESDCSCVTTLYRDAENVQTFDRSLTIPFYEQFLSHQDHAVYYGTDPTAGPVVVCVGDPDAKGLRRVMVLTKKESKRFVVPQSKSYLRAVRAAYPILMNVDLSHTSSNAIREALLRFEKGTIFTRHKFGVLLALPGQKDELEMFNNPGTTPAFDEFLGFLGDKIELQGWKDFRGGLDAKSGNTGTHSVYARIADIEVMFHVAAFIPHKEGDRQQVDRKRHIGNDICVVIFKERGAPGDVVNLGSFLTHFNHVFVVVSPEDVGGETAYRVNVAVKPAVGTAPPYLPDPPLLRKTPELREWFLQKLVSMERAAMQSPHFQSGQVTTRKANLEDIIKLCEQQHD